MVKDLDTSKQTPRTRKHIIIALALAVAFGLLLSLTLVLFLLSGSSPSGGGSTASPASAGGGLAGGGSTTQQSGNSSSGGGSTFTTADWLGLMTAFGTFGSGVGAVISSIAVVKSRNAQVAIASYEHSVVKRQPKPAPRRHSSAQRH